MLSAEVWRGAGRGEELVVERNSLELEVMRGHTTQSFRKSNVFRRSLRVLQQQTSIGKCFKFMLSLKFFASPHIA